MRIVLLLCLFFHKTIGQYDYGGPVFGVIGEPIVKCNDKNFEVTIETQSPFEGVLFVENYMDDAKCRSMNKHQSRNISIQMGFNDCGVERRMSDLPRGVFVSAQLVLAFHQDLLTKVDRIYKVQCFYMEMERELQKTIQVNMPPPVLHSKQVKMPVCKYEVLNGSPSGAPVFYATVGQMVYHKWSCEAEQPNTFCMTVHSCYVDDGNGDRVQLINQDGCALDKYLLTNLEYPEDLMAGREAHVYKYADRDNMYFDCQITVRLKEYGAEYCDIPTCPDPPRRRRSNIVDDEIEVDERELESNYTIPNDMIAPATWMELHFNMQNVDLCISTTGLSSLLGIHMALVLFSTAIIVYSVVYSRNNTKH